jgi:hypothetical protein
MIVVYADRGSVSPNTWRRMRSTVCSCHALDLVTIVILWCARYQRGNECFDETEEPR